MHIYVSGNPCLCVLCVLISLLDCIFFLLFTLDSHCFLCTDVNVLLSVRLSAGWLDPVSAPKQITLARGKQQSNNTLPSLNLLLLTSFHKQTPLTFNICASITIQTKSNKSFHWMNCPATASPPRPPSETFRDTSLKICPCFPCQRSIGDKTCNSNWWSYRTYRGHSKQCIKSLYPH